MKNLKGLIGCWICDKFIDYDDKVRDHCHITGKYRGAAHWSCNINLVVIFTVQRKY